MATSKQRLMDFGKSVLIVGISGAASVAVTDYALDRYTDWCGVKRGVIQGLGHIALGAVIAAAGAPAVGAGVAVGGVVSGMEDVIAWVRMSEAERATATSAARARLAATSLRRRPPRPPRDRRRASCPRAFARRSSAASARTRARTSADSASRTTTAHTTRTTPTGTTYRSAVSLGGRRSQTKERRSKWIRSTWLPAPARSSDR